FALQRGQFFFQLLYRGQFSGTADGSFTGNGFGSHFFNGSTGRRFFGGGFYGRSFGSGSGFCCRFFCSCRFARSHKSFLAAETRSFKKRIIRNYWPELSAGRIFSMVFSSHSISTSHSSISLLSV